jgi:hypothetical protein
VGDVNKSTVASYLFSIFTLSIKETPYRAYRKMDPHAFAHHLESLHCRVVILESAAFEPTLNTAEDSNPTPDIMAKLHLDPPLGNAPQPGLRGGGQDRYMDAMFTLVKSLADPGVRQIGASKIAFTINARPMALELTMAKDNTSTGLITPDNVKCWIIYTNKSGYRDMIPAEGRHKVRTQLEKFIKEL